MNEININTKFNIKKLFLVGFMATGKTTIGRRLSSKLHLPFYDSDKEIEMHLKCSINEYFKSHGESKFREIEEKIIIDKINSNQNAGFIMSLGGGSFLSNNIRLLIKSVGISIWLNGDIDIVYNRIIKSKNERPLALIYNKKKKLEKLLKERVFYYEKADIKVDIIKTSKDTMADIILKKLNNHLSLNNDQN